MATASNSSSGNVVFGATDVATAGTRVALGTGLFRNLWVAAKEGNTVVVEIGGADVDGTTGAALGAGGGPDSELTINCGPGAFVNLADIYIDAASSTPGVVWVAWR